MIYAIYYSFEDGGRGDSPVLRTIDTEKEMREFLEVVLDGVPEAHRSGMVDDLMATIARDNHLDVRLEDLVEELARDTDLDLEYVTLEDDAALRVEVAHARQVPSRDIETINRHRASYGAPPLDPSTGWSEEELRTMADNIRRYGREVNPEIAAAKERLLR